MCGLLDRAPSVYVAMRPRHPLQVMRLAFDGGERLARDQLLDVAVQLAAVRQAHFEPVQPALPALYPRLRTQAMFEKQEAPAPLQDAVYFAQSLMDIVNAAQRKRADHTIERAILKRKPLAADHALLNPDTGLLDPPPRQPVHADIRINHRETAHSFGIIRQVQPGAEADFYNVPVGIGEQFPSLRRHERLPQKEVAEAREYHLCVEAHDGLPVRSFPCKTCSPPSRRLSSSPQTSRVTTSEGPRCSPDAIS